MSVAWQKNGHRNGVSKRRKEHRYYRGCHEAASQIQGNNGQRRDKEEKNTKIAVVRCDIVSETCPGVACFKAFNKRKVHFEQYGKDAGSSDFHMRWMPWQGGFSGLWTVS